MHEAEQVAPTLTTQHPAEPSAEHPKDQASRFLEFLFRGAAPGFVEFRRTSPGRRTKIVGKPAFRRLPLDCDAVAEETLSAHAGGLVAVGAAPRCRIPPGGKPGKDCDVLQVGCVWADVDYTRAAGGAIEAIRRVRDFPLSPSVVVTSGRGRQVYYVLDAQVSEGRLLDWDELIRELNDLLGGSGAVNPSHALPLPGGRTSEEDLAFSIDEDDSSWRRYDFDDLREAARRSRELRREGSAGAAATAAPATLAERGVPREVLEVIASGQLPARNGLTFSERRDYHERDLWVATSLLDCGLGPEEVKAVFRANPRGCGAKWALERNGERYLEFTVRTAAALRRRAGRGDESSDDEARAYVEMPPGYELDGDGSIWHRPAAGEGGAKPPKPVMVANSYIGIAAIQENVDTRAVSMVIEYKYLGRPRRKTILRSQMADSRRLVSSLAGEGAPVTTVNARHVTSYLDAYEHAFGQSLPRRRVTSRFGRGRDGGPFLLPGVESGVEFSPAGDGDASLFRAYSSRRGSLPGWLDPMRTVVGEGLMIPQAAVLTSFVPPLQSRLQIPNFILDIHGSTSTGKSTALKLAASVYGSFTDPDSLVMQWMNTNVAVEQLAGVCSELPIFLDDAQHCPVELKRTAVYMIANGRGKGRASRAGGMGEVSTWHTVALSTSEEPLHEASPHEGARGRILPVGGSVHPFPPGSGELVQSLERSALLNHGYAGEAYVRHLNELSPSDWVGLRRRYLEIRKAFLSGSGSNVVDRVGGYIAAIQLAAEIACPLLRLPFKPESVGTWLLLHLVEEQGRQNHTLLALRSLADFCVKHGALFSGHERYDPAGKAGLYGAVQQGRFVAYLRDTFDAACRRHKWNPTAVLNKLADAGALVTTEDDRHTKRVSVGRVKHRMICVKWSALFPEDYMTITTEGGRVLRRPTHDGTDETAESGRTD